jgi:hypothetical protein
MVGFFINFSENQNIEYTKKSLEQATDEVQRMGGPRDGKGGAVAAAICAAAIGCNAWAKDEGLLNWLETGAGGIPNATHKTQSMLWAVESALSESPEETTFIAPPVVHTSSMALGATRGDAMATPKDNTNHASTKRTRILICLNSCIFKS